MKKLYHLLILPLISGIARYYPEHIFDFDEFLAEAGKKHCSRITIKTSLQHFAYRNLVSGLICCECASVPYGRCIYFSKWIFERMTDHFSEEKKRTYTLELLSHAEEYVKYIRKRLPDIEVLVEDRSNEETMGFLHVAS